MSGMRLGNNLWEQVKFNSRQQPYDTRLGLSSGDFSRLRLELGYGTTANSGNLQSQTITAGGTTISQTYTYDQVNRLWTATEAGVWSQTYQYDQWGNRAVTAGYVPNTTLTPQVLSAFNTANNRLHASQYDLAGNQTRTPKASSSPMTPRIARQVSTTGRRVTTTTATDAGLKR